MERYGLAASPFVSRADAGFVPVASRAEPLDRLAESLRDAQGIALLTGASGLGKTALCRELARQFREEGWLVALLPGAGLTTRRSLLQAILYELGLPYIGLTEQEARLRLLQSIRDRRPQCPALILLVDEAQRLSPRLLEELRALINHEQEGQPLVRVLLSGDLTLEERLLEPELAAVHQRIVCHETLPPLSLEESARLLDEQIMRAGGDGWDHVFTPTAIELVCLVSDGRPRNLEQLAHRSLVIADAAGEPRVSVESVRRALEELRELPLQWNEPSNLEIYSVRDRAEADPNASLVPRARQSQEAPMSSRPPSRPEDLRAEDAVAVIVGDELPSPGEAPPLVGAVSIEVGGGANARPSERTGSLVVEPGPASAGLEALFTRGAAAEHALIDEIESPGLADTAILTETGETAPAAVEGNDSSTVMPSTTGPVPAWLELEVEDRYAALDAAQTGPTTAALYVPAVPREAAAAPAGSLGEVERRLLFEVQELTAEIAAARPSPPPPSPVAMPEDSAEAPECEIVRWPGIAPHLDWDVIQPEWLADRPFEPVEIDPGLERERERERDLLTAGAANVEPSRQGVQSPDNPEDHPEDAPAAFEESPEPVVVIRVDPPADRPYAQLFSRLRRLRASVGERLSAAVFGS